MENLNENQETQRESRTIAINNIPADLRLHDQWVCWRMVTKDGKLTKVPVNAHTGELAETDNPTTWASFDQAVDYFNMVHGIEGIGFVFSKDDPFTGIDLDKCLNPETNEIESWAKDIVSKMNSYTENSPSRKGVHILVKGKLPPVRRKKGNIEMYDSLRFFTVTGEHLKESPVTIEDRDGELKSLHRRTFPPPEFVNPAADTEKQSSPSLTDPEIIIKASQAANGGKFSRLWQGSWQGDYPSQSEADSALCFLLAFWTQDPAQIDRLFRQSKLIREKWDSPRADSTYGANTVRTAINYVISLGEIYQGGVKHKPIQDSETCQEGKSNQHGEKPNGMAQLPIANSNRILPEWVMSGAAGKFARAYGEYLETPPQFLFMSYLTILGHLISGRITLSSELKPQPRLYTVLLGESGDTRKSTAINKTREFFMETLLKDKLNLILGIGSAEGMAKALDRNNKGLLIFDEFKAFVQKCKIDSSVLLPCINSLFENNDYQNLTQDRKIDLTKAHVSILAASTIEIYQNMFTSRFSDIGFTNRLFVVLGDSNRRFAIPQQIPFELKEELKRDLYEVHEYVETSAKGECFLLPINDEALEIFEKWYHNQEQSVFTKRLDTYGHRLMLLLAVNERQYTVTAEVANKVVALLNYQLAARREADPIDADNAIARLEERIRRSLKNGQLSKRELERKCNKSKCGNWQWKTAIDNLQKADEIAITKSNAYLLKG